MFALQWCHNEHDGVSYHWCFDCLLKRLFRSRSKKISKLLVTGLCEGNSPVTGEFPTQRASNTENISIWWRHHGKRGHRYTNGKWSFAPITFAEENCYIYHISMAAADGSVKYFYRGATNSHYYDWKKSPNSTNSKTSSHQILQSLEAAKFWAKIFVSFWNLTHALAALLLICLSNFRGIRWLSKPISHCFKTWK